MSDTINEIKHSIVNEGDELYSKKSDESFVGSSEKNDSGLISINKIDERNSLK